MEVSEKFKETLKGFNGNFERICLYFSRMIWKTRQEKIDFVSLLSFNNSEISNITHHHHQMAQEDTRLSAHFPSSGVSGFIDRRRTSEEIGGLHLLACEKDKMTDSGESGVGSSSSMSSRDKESKNKGKGILDESSPHNPINVPFRSSSTALPQYELSSEKSQNQLSGLPSVGSGSSQCKGATVGESQPAEWDDPHVRELEKLLSDNLLTLFSNAIKEIIKCGYSEDAAKKSISRHGLYCGGKDVLHNIVKDTLAHLDKAKRLEDSSVHVLDLPQLAEYTLLEMVNVLKEVKPSLSTVDAMWSLLMCDMNMSQACTEDIMNLHHNKQVSGDSSSVSTPTQSRSEAQSSKLIPSNTTEPNDPKPLTLDAKGNLPEALRFGSYPNSPNLTNSPTHEELLSQSQRDSKHFMAEMKKSVRSIQEHVQSSSLAPASDEKLTTSGKGRSKKELAALRQMSSHGRTVKTYKSYGKGLAFKSGKLASLGGLSVEKKPKPPSEASVEPVKGASSKVRIERGGAPNPPLTIPVTSRLSMLSTNGNLSVLPAANTVLVASSSSEKKPKPPSEASVEPVKGASSKVRIERGGAPNPPLTIPVTSRLSMLSTNGNLSVLPAANTVLVASSSSEKKPKPPSEASVEPVKGASSKVRMERGGAPNPPLTIPVSGRSSMLSTKGNLSALPAANTELVASSSSEKNPAPKAETSTPVSLKISDYYAGIPFDESLGKYVPQNEKDELILRLVPRVQDLQNALNGWTEWAHEKVKQAAQRLSKDRSELKELRQEKQEVEQWKTRELKLAQSTVKSLTEVESAWNNATRKVEESNSALRKLEEENTLIKKDLVAAKLLAEESAATSHEALRMEKKLQTSASTWERVKGLLQEEYQTEKQKVAELQQELDKAKEYHNQIEVLCKRERAEKEKLLAQAASIRSERKQLGIAAKEEEGRIKLKAEKEKKKLTEEMQKLKVQLSLLKFESDSCKMAALRDGGFGRIPSGSKSAANPATRKGKQISGLKEERECVMCLEEEMSVVFLPCAHQVLCPKCNDLHEKQGMKECPSCRTPIKKRIRVRSAKE